MPEPATLHPAIRSCGEECRASQILDWALSSGHKLWVIESFTGCVRWDRFIRFLDDGRVCLTNNAAERALRGFALGRKSWLFAGSERGADRAAVMATLITTAKMK